MQLRALILLSMLISAALGCTRYEPMDQPILFGRKRFIDLPKDTIFVSGTLTGEDVGFTNNTYGIYCSNVEMQCVVVDVVQVGPNQIGDLNVPLIYEVTSWNEDLVVAFTMDAIGCRRETISLLRKAQSVSWVQELAKDNVKACEGVDKSTYRWTIEDAPGWKDIAPER